MRRHAALHHSSDSIRRTSCIRHATVFSATPRIAAASACVSCWPATSTAVSRSAGLSRAIALFSQMPS